MAVEAGRDQQQLRPEGLQRRQQAGPPGVAERRAAAARGQRRVDHVADTGVVLQAGTGVQRMLVRAQVLHAWFGGEDGLGAVAVVHVEIDHRHARQAVRVHGVRGADGDAVQQAEAHCGIAGGVVAGRAHGAEDPRHLARQHRVDGCDHRAGGAARGLGRGRRHRGVGIEAQQGRAVELRVEDRIDQRGGVHPRRGLAAGERSFPPVEAGKGGVQRIQHRLQARRAFRVAGTGLVVEAGRVGVDAHQRRRSWRQSTSPWPLPRASTRQSTNSRSESRLR